MTTIEELITDVSAIKGNRNKEIAATLESLRERGAIDHWAKIRIKRVWLVSTNKGRYRFSEGEAWAYALGVQDASR